MSLVAETGPLVAWDDALGGWAVCGYDLVRDLLRDNERLTSEGTFVAENLAGEAMLVTDSPVHDAVRSLWAKTFSPASVASRRAELERLADRLLAPVLARLGEGEAVDLVPVFEQFAGTVVLGLLDLPEISEERFRRWYRLLLDSAAFAITPDHPLYRDRVEAKVEVYAMLEAELESRLERVGEGEAPGDLISLIAAGEGRAGITRRVALDNLFNVFTGGADTTVRWIGNAVAAFHRHPSVLAELRDAPALLPQALEEVMRLESVTRFAIRRVRIEGVELAGKSLPRGDTVYLLTSLANRDPTVFDEPERLDIHRRGKPHLGFSHGMHLCIGMHLARVEAQAFLRRLLALPALELVAVEYGDEAVVHGPERLTVRLGGEGG